MSALALLSNSLLIEETIRQIIIIILLDSLKTRITIMTLTSKYLSRDSRAITANCPKDSNPWFSVVRPIGQSHNMNCNVSSKFIRITQIHSKQTRTITTIIIISQIIIIHVGKSQIITRIIIILGLYSKESES